MIAHKTRDALAARLPYITEAVKDHGLLRAIVVRPRAGERITPDHVDVSSAGGVQGDHWAKGCWQSLPDGSPDPDVQICMMSARCIEVIAGPIENWAPAGDNLFIDMDLTPGNMPPGQRFNLGTAMFEVTPVAHNGCSSFIEHYGRDATVFVNTGEGKRLRLRGIYARVIKDGQISVGHRLEKLV